MRKYYQTKDIASNLDIQRPPNITFHHDPLLNAIKKFENHPSILEIKEASSVGCRFSILIPEIHLK